MPDLFLFRSFFPCLSQESGSPATSGTCRYGCARPASAGTLLKRAVFLHLVARTFSPERKRWISPIVSVCWAGHIVVNRRGGSPDNAVNGALGGDSTVEAAADVSLELTPLRDFRQGADSTRKRRAGVPIRSA